MNSSNFSGKFKILFFSLLITLISSTAWAQNAQLKTTPNKPKDKRAECPDGWYSGPSEGKRLYYQDPYQWFISPEFSKKLCMPESFIDPGLKDVLAIATRVKPREFALCGYMNRTGACSVEKDFLIEIYIDNTKFTLPKKLTNVKYYAGVIQNSGWMTGVSVSVLRRYFNDEMPEVEGELRPFTPNGKSLNGDSIKMLYLESDGEMARPLGVFMEKFYRSNWIPGIDLISLSPYTMGYGEMPDPDAAPDKKWLVGFIDSKIYYDLMADKSQKSHKISEYSNVITLPKEISRLIYKFDHAEGVRYKGAVNKALDGGFGGGEK